MSLISFLHLLLNIFSYFEYVIIILIKTQIFSLKLTNLTTYHKNLSLIDFHLKSINALLKNINLFLFTYEKEIEIILSYFAICYCLQAIFNQDKLSINLINLNGYLIILILRNLYHANNLIILFKNLLYLLIFTFLILSLLWQKFQRNLFNYQKS